MSGTQATNTPAKLKRAQNEARAVQRIVRIIGELPETSQKRVLDWAVNLWNEEIETAPAAPNGESGDVRDQQMTNPAA